MKKIIQWDSNSHQGGKKQKTKSKKSSVQGSAGPDVRTPKLCCFLRDEFGSPICWHPCTIYNEICLRLSLNYFHHQSLCAPLLLTFKGKRCRKCSEHTGRASVAHENNVSLSFEILDFLSFLGLKTTQFRKTTKMFETWLSGCLNPWLEGVLASFKKIK